MSVVCIDEMKKGYDNKKLDRIGRRLFDAEPLAAGVIDEIVAKRDLFSLVRERIAADQAASIAGLRRTSPVRRYVAALSGAALMVVAGAAAINFYRPEKAVVNFPATVASINEMPVSRTNEDTDRLVTLPQPTVAKLTTERPARDTSKLEKAVLQRTEPVIKPRRTAEPSTRFLPVSYTGDPDETSGGGQVIRVEMKRSSLFALGVNVPLENDNEIVKAELIVGRDGVTRGIRVVD